MRRKSKMTGKKCGCLRWRIKYLKMSTMNQNRRMRLSALRARRHQIHIREHTRTANTDTATDGMRLHFYFCECEHMYNCTIVPKLWLYLHWHVFYIIFSYLYEFTRLFSAGTAAVAAPLVGGVMAFHAVLSLQQSKRYYTWIVILLWNDCSCRNGIGFDVNGKWRRSRGMLMGQKL